MNVLFICSQNKWRSPTAENMYRRVEGLNVRSAGTSKSARKRLKQADVQWADLICVMEETHLAQLRSDFRNDLRQTSVHVLDIPDDYRYMDPELIALIETAMTPLLKA